MKKQTFAGMTAAAALAGTALVMAQQGTQPGMDRPQNRPGQVNRPAQPGSPGMPGMRQESQETFQYVQEVARLTEQWQQKCEQTTEQLKNQLQQAQSAQGEQKVDALVQIVEKLIQEREESADGMIKHTAMTLRHELESANVPQDQVRQLEQQYAFLSEAGTSPIRGIQQPDLGEDDKLKDPSKPDRPGQDDPLGPR